MAPRFAAAVGLVVAAALVMPATAATPKAGSFSGSTDQNKSISFTVTPGGAKVKKLKFGFKGNCDNGARVEGRTSSSAKFPITDEGKFRAELGDSLVKGKFTRPKKAKGILKANTSSFDPFSLRTVECHSGKVRWHAKR